MDDEIDSLVLSIRADTGAFATDVGAMRAQMDGPLTQGVGAAGSAIGAALGRATKLGSAGFGDLRSVALKALGEIAASAIKVNLGALGGTEGGLGPLLGGALASLGLPGRASGGPVSGGRPYLVGERGPEMFVPGPGGGRVQPLSGGGAATTITVNVAAAADSGQAYMTKTGNQVALAVRRALDAGGGR